MSERAPTRTDWHVLSNVNEEAKSADCRVCGPNITIMVKYRRRDGKTERRCASKFRKAAKPGRNRHSIQTTPVELKQAYEQQDGRCALCDRQVRMTADHDHVTGVFRAWLCATCNRRLGINGEDYEWMERAAAYLRTHGATPRWRRS